MRISDLHIHNRTGTHFPSEQVECFTVWAALANEACSLMRGFRPLPKETHIWVKSVKSASCGEAHYTGKATVWVARLGYPHNGGDGRMMDGIDYICNDWAEMLVSLVVHEACHLRGVPGLAKSNKRDKSSRGPGWASGDRTGEQLAQIIAMHLLHEFRAVRPGLELSLTKIKTMQD